MIKHTLTDEQLRKRLERMNFRIEKVIRRYIEENPIGGIKIDEETYLVKGRTMA
jgi:predicted transcriptional regulator